MGLLGFFSPRPIPTQARADFLQMAPKCLKLYKARPALFVGLAQAVPNIYWADAGMGRAGSTRPNWQLFR